MPTPLTDPDDLGLARNHPCHTCKAKPGEPCTSSGGYKLTAPADLHGPRRRRAQAVREARKGAGDLR